VWPLSQSVEATVEWIIQHVDEIFERYPDLKKKLYEKLREEIAEEMVTKEEIRQILIEIRNLREDFNRLSTRLELRLEALGARWGILSERSFREGMKYIIEKFFGGRVSRWEYYDEQGYVYGAPSVVDVDVLIKDSEHILVEIKSRIDRSDVVVFRRKADLYEKTTGTKANLVMISPYVTDQAIDLASKLNIKIIKGIPGTE